MIIKNLDKAGALLDLINTKRLRSGLVILQPGEEVGLHVTNNCEEVIIVLEGQATIYLKDQKQKVETNQLIYIPCDESHNVKNETDKILRYIYLVSLN